MDTIREPENRGTHDEHMEPITKDYAIKTLKKLREWVMLKPSEVAAITLAINLLDGRHSTSELVLSGKESAD